MTKVKVKTFTKQNENGKVCCVLTKVSAGEMYYASMMEELEKDGKDFEADSWSLAVDSSYLQSQRKDVIKRQDVIYGEIVMDHTFNTFMHIQLVLGWILSCYMHASLKNTCEFWLW